MKKLVYRILYFPVLGFLFIFGCTAWALQLPYSLFRIGDELWHRYESWVHNIEYQKRPLKWLFLETIPGL